MSVGLGKVLCWFVRFEATALYRLTETGACAAFSPMRRKIVSRSWYATAGWSLVKSVSIATKPSASPCARTEVRWKSSSLYVQRPRMYHFAQRPVSSLGLTSDWIQVPGDVFEFHDETTSLNGKLIGYSGEVQVPYR